MTAGLILTVGPVILLFMVGLVMLNYILDMLIDSLFGIRRED